MGDMNNMKILRSYYDLSLYGEVLYFSYNHTKN